MINSTLALDPHAQLRALYQSLLSNQSHFDEFKQLLALYTGVSPENITREPPEAAEVRRKLNDRIRSWVPNVPMSDLSAAQVLQWRAIIVEERINVAISPWKEANIY